MPESDFRRRGAWYADSVTTLARSRLEEFLANPTIEERRLELIDGEVCEKPTPT